MTGQPVTLSLSEELAELARETARQRAYVHLSNTPNIDIDSVKWDADGSMRVAGPFVPDAIVGCKAEARIRIPWSRANSEPKRIYHAAKALDEVEVGPAWIRAIIAHERPPQGPTTQQDVAALRWSVKRNGKPVFNAPDELLTFPAKVIGER